MSNATDSVSIFAEGTFEEQIQELLNYIARNKSEEEGTGFLGPFQHALRGGEGQKPLLEDEPKRKLILSKLLQEVDGMGVGDGTDKEIEGFFNLLFAHLLALHPASSSEAEKYIGSLLKTLASSTSDRLPLRCRILSNLFNALPRTSPQRPRVFAVLLEIASSSANLDALQLSIATVERWLSEWDIPVEQKASYLKSISEAYTKSEQSSEAFEYYTLYVKTLPPSSDEARRAAVDAIATGLRLPTIMDFDPLFKIDAVVAVKGHELFGLLQVFLSGGLPEYQSWASSHSSSLEQNNIPAAEVEHKIRLLTLASLAFKHVGQSVSYSTIAEEIQVDVSEVESWAINAIRAGLIWGKLSQTTQSLYITRATARTFEREQWEALEKRLVAWKTGLSSILDVVAGAKRQGGQTATAAA